MLYLVISEDTVSVRLITVQLLNPPFSSSGDRDGAEKLLLRVFPELENAQLVLRRISGLLSTVWKKHLLTESLSVLCATRTVLSSVFCEASRFYIVNPSVWASL